MATGGSRLGFLVTFEGIEGCGKSTQLQAIAARLRGYGLKVDVAREPGGTDVGELIRQVIRKPYYRRRILQWMSPTAHRIAMAPAAELFLFEAARAQLVRDLVIPSLRKRHVVLLDRFTDSTIAYQGYGRGLPLAGIESANQMATSGYDPDLTYWIDVPVEVGLTRKFGELGVDFMGSQTVSFYDRVRKGYSEIADRNPARVRRIDGTLPADQITDLIEADIMRVWLLVQEFRDLDIPRKFRQRRFA
ncbi:MAG: dTMP kinase [Dehalococcoidia bacterium]